MNQSACAEAHPNIALVKYWGKAAEGENVPSSPSLSITLNQLAARTTVEPGASGFYLNGQAKQDPKVDAWVRAARTAFDLPDFAIRTSTNFPIGSGLASSAAGFAALITALDAAFGLRLSRLDQSVWARRGSGSAARSIPGGFASLENVGGIWSGQSLYPPEHWKLEVAVAMTSRRQKAEGSTEGMVRSKATSPFFSNWVQSIQEDFKAARAALESRDFDCLAQISESNCLRMHAVMIAARPPLLYWNPVTVAVIHAITQLRESGVPVFFTMDAGPQVKAVCSEGEGSFVSERLRKIPGVLEVVQCGIGGGARVIQD